MTARTVARPLALLAGVAIFVAACGGGTATQAPATQAPVTQAPVTQAPAATSGAVETFPTASFHGDVDLEAMIPDEIGGEKITTLSMTGEQFMGSGGGSDEFAAIMTGLGKQPKDLSVAFGGTSKISIIAFQVDGVPGSQILEAFKNASTDGATLSDVTFGGKAVKKVTPADSDDGISYVYTTQDVVFVVTGTALTDALLNEVFSNLP
jgi:hypothetical protein